MLLRVVLHLGEVAAEEDLLFLLAERDRAELVAHAVLAHHAAGELGGLLDVVARAGGGVAEDQLLGGAAAEHHLQAVDAELLATSCAARRPAPAW